MCAAVTATRLSLILGLTVVAGSATAFDSGSEPIYRLLPEIAFAGADLPPDAPGFATTVEEDGRTILRWGQLFRIADDQRVFGRFTGRDAVLPDTGDPGALLSRSPNGHFLALTIPDGGEEDAGVRIMPMAGEAPARGFSASDLPAVLTDASCAAAGAADETGASGADAPKAELISARWTDDYGLSAIWRAAEGAEFYETGFQVTADGKAHLTGCKPVDTAVEATAPYVPPRDLVARARMLTFVRLTVMAEPTKGNRPRVLITGPGPVFSTSDLDDPAVRDALAASLSYLAVVPAAAPQSPGTLRRTAGNVAKRPADQTEAPLPSFRTGGLSAIRRGLRSGEGGGEGRGGSGEGGGG
jgi:hypothetical protein